MHDKSRLLAWVATGLMLQLPSWAGAPFAFDAAPGRLPKGVVPIDYTIAIVPDAMALKLSGTERVTLRVRASTATIQFNTLHMTLGDVRFDGKPVKSTATDDASQLTTVTLHAPADPGLHRLSFSYSGQMKQSPEGMFIQPYLGRDGAQHIVIATQLESTAARQVFPCWDEPAFRATWTLAMTAPANWTAISNMPAARRVVHGELATTTFARTPRMPSYLVNLVAGDFAALHARVGRTRIAVWIVRGNEQQGTQAVADTRQILADYNDYFDYPFPLPKLDSIALPSGFSTAMENWGAINYDESYLLLGPDSTFAKRKEIYVTQAHEIAHQWFGDLVTMGWWDDIWLNESFAEWMDSTETALRHPEWNWWQGQDAAREAAMNADASATSHPLQQPVATEAEADASMDGAITYMKGEAVLRMLEAWLGPDTFRAGVRQYMKAHAYSNATTSDLWIALDRASGRKVREISSGWTTQPGFPLVSVTAHCDANGSRAVTLSQHRFLASEAASSSAHWQVPLQIRIGAGGAARAVLLHDDDQLVPAGRCDEVLSLNAGAIGYYRVQYDTATLATITAQFANLPAGDRIALLDDQWALASTGRAPLKDYLALVAASGTELNARAWEQAAASLATVEYAVRGAPSHDAFTSYARLLVRPTFERLGWDAQPGESTDVRELRRTLVASLGAWGDPAIVAEARRRFDAFVADHGTLAPDDQALVLDIVARDADAETFEQLHALARSAHTQPEFERYYGALMQVRDPALAGRAAGIALSTEIPPQAGSVRGDLIATLAQEHQLLSWQAFTANSGQLMERFGSSAPSMLAQYTPATYWSDIPPGQVEAWVRAHVPPELGPVVDQGMAVAGARQAEKARLARQVEASLP